MVQIFAQSSWTISSSISVFCSIMNRLLLIRQSSQARLASDHFEKRKEKREKTQSSLSSSGLQLPACSSSIGRYFRRQNEIHTRSHKLINDSVELTIMRNRTPDPITTTTNPVGINMPVSHSPTSVFLQPSRCGFVTIPEWSSPGCVYIHTVAWSGIISYSTESRKQQALRKNGVHFASAGC